MGHLIGRGSDRRPPNRLLYHIYRIELTEVFWEESTDRSSNEAVYVIKDLESLGLFGHATYLFTENT